tara:strand:+ start:16 stop:618 length:603 start_codon:yes stop_codon:yes gene_type:complete
VGLALYVIISIALIILGVQWNSPKWVGKRGENRVKRHLLRIDQTQYKLFNDINIPNTKAKSGKAQVDHILVSEFGIFVIETKNYSGWIFGSAERKYWTQVIFDNRYQMYNPIKQNWGHIYALSEFLKVPQNKFHNIVTFVGNAEFRTQMPKGVFYDSQYIDYITSFKNKVLSEADVDNITRMLLMEKDKEDSEKIDCNRT